MDHKPNVSTDSPPLAELSFRAVSPGSQVTDDPSITPHLLLSAGRNTVSLLQRSLSVEEQRRGAASKTPLNELLDTLKLLEEEPEGLSDTRSYCRDKYAWIDEVSPAGSSAASPARA